MAHGCPTPAGGGLQGRPQDVPTARRAVLGRQGLPLLGAESRPIPPVLLRFVPSATQEPPRAPSAQEVVSKSDIFPAGISGYFKIVSFADHLPKESGSAAHMFIRKKRIKNIQNTESPPLLRRGTSCPRPSAQAAVLPHHPIVPGSPERPAQHQRAGELSELLTPDQGCALNTFGSAQPHHGAGTGPDAPTLTAKPQGG